MAPSLIQTCLEVSDTGNLTFVTPRRLLPYAGLAPRSRWPGSSAAAESKIDHASNTETPILQFPHELLRQCFEAVDELDIKLSQDHSYVHRYYYGEADADDAINEDDRKSSAGFSADEGDDYDAISADNLWPAKHKIHVRYEAIYALTLTCKRFHDIAVPMLYARPNFSKYWKHRRSGPSPCEIFYDAVTRSSSLSSLVKHLALNGEDFSHDFVHISIAFSNLRSLHLTLFQQGFRHEFVQMCLKFPNLHSLVLENSYDRDGEEEQAAGPSPEMEGTATLTQLRLCSIRTRPPDLKRFLKWPKQLKSFALDDITFDGYDWQYTEPNPAFRWSHTILTDVLSPQRHNLRVLKLGWMGYTPGQNLFDVSLFTNLHTLQLCVAYDKPDAVACQNWLTATIQTIILDFGPNDSQGGKLSWFLPADGPKAIDFAQLASEEKKQRPASVGLQEIGIVAYHTGECALTGDSEWLCHHDERCEGDADKTEILFALRGIEAHGFSAFWVGASEAKHTVQMMEKACHECAALAPHKVEV